MEKTFSFEALSITRKKKGNINKETRCCSTEFVAPLFAEIFLLVSKLFFLYVFDWHSWKLSVQDV